MGELKDPVIIEKTKPYWVCFQRCPYWLTGESTRDVWARRKASTVGTEAQRYPDDYPGRIVSVVDGSKERPGWTRGELTDAIKLDLTPAQYAAAGSRQVKVVAGALVPVAVADRFGAATAVLLTKYSEAELVAAKDAAPDPGNVVAMETQMAISEEITRAVKTLPACGDAIEAVR